MRNFEGKSTPRAHRNSGCAWWASPSRTSGFNLRKVQEQKAAEKLDEPPPSLSTVTQAMQFRYLATLFDIAGERSSTIVFPFPIDLMQVSAAKGPAPGG